MSNIDKFINSEATELLSNQEMDSVIGGSSLGDALEWVGEKMSQFWKWLTIHGNTDGTTGVHWEF